jgi:hypothetical protein
MPTYRTLACRLFDAGIIVPEANILPPTLQMQDVCTRHIKDTVRKRCCQFRIWDMEVHGISGRLPEIADWSLTAEGRRDCGFTDLEEKGEKISDF